MKRPDLGQTISIIAKIGVIAGLAAIVIIATGCAVGRSASLSWLAPTENTDGSPLTDLAGYKIYWGQSPSNLNNSVTVIDAGITSYVVDELTRGTWFFSVTAVDADGLESSFSNISAKTIR